MLFCLKISFVQNHESFFNSTSFLGLRRKTWTTTSFFNFRQVNTTYLPNFYCTQGKQCCWKGKLFLGVKNENVKKESERNINGQLAMLQMVGLSTKPGVYQTLLLSTHGFFITYFSYKLRNTLIFHMILYDMISSNTSTPI